jgi:GNAT superfamily N-acetyltransferase
MPQTEQATLKTTNAPDLSLLDNPIWTALNTGHQHLAVGDTLARRYPAEIGPLSGLREDSSANYEALHQLASPGEALALFLGSPFLPHRGWTLIRDGRLDQMVCAKPKEIQREALPHNATLRELTPADIPQMIALAELTEPGPFRIGTSSLGRFFGIFEGDRLLAMAGQRLYFPGLREVSAVCTHPDARGRGYARAAMIEIINDMVSRGETPFLHVLAANTAAIRVYTALGFTRRRSFELAVLQAD